MSNATLFLAIKNGGGAIGISPSMPAFSGHLTNDEMAGLVSYIRGFCAEPEPRTDSIIIPSARR